MEYVGLLGGMALALLGLYIGRRAAKNRQGLDELHEHIWRKARSISWYFTLVAIYMLLILSMLDAGVRLIPALSILLLVHLGSWGVAGGMLMAKMVEDDPGEGGKTQLLLSIFIGIVFLIGFGIVSALTENWKFLLFSLFPIFTMIMVFYAQAMFRRRQSRDPQ